MDLNIVASLNTSPKRALIPVSGGVAALVACWVAFQLLSPHLAGAAVGLVAAALVSAAILIAMPRGTQLGVFGAALGVSLDGGYALVTEQTPVTIANGLINIFTALTKAVGIVADGAGPEYLAAIKWGVWTFILAIMLIMICSFFIKHDD
jgi:hypothetical protein